MLSSALSFYAAQRFSGLIDHGGDMLLFQYGVYDWGTGPYFEVDLTRQFIERMRDDDDNVFSQFSVTFRYEPTPELAALGANERWCGDLSELEDFADWVREHPALAAAERGWPTEVRVGWGLV